MRSRTLKNIVNGGGKAATAKNNYILEGATWELGGKGETLGFRTELGPFRASESGSILHHKLEAPLTLWSNNAALSQREKCSVYTGLVSRWNNGVNDMVVQERLKPRSFNRTTSNPILTAFVCYGENAVKNRRQHTVTKEWSSDPTILQRCWSKKYYKGNLLIFMYPFTI